MLNYRKKLPLFSFGGSRKLQLIRTMVNRVCVRGESLKKVSKILVIFVGLISGSAIADGFCDQLSGKSFAFRFNSPTDFQDVGEYFEDQTDYKVVLDSGVAGEMKLKSGKLSPAAACNLLVKTFKKKGYTIFHSEGRFTVQGTGKAPGLQAAKKPAKKAAQPKTAKKPAKPIAKPKANTVSNAKKPKDVSVPLPNGGQIYKVVCYATRVRTGPSKQYKTLRYMAKDIEFKVVAKQTNWLRMEDGYWVSDICTRPKG